MYGKLLLLGSLTCGEENIYSHILIHLTNTYWIPLYVNKMTV